MEMTWAEFSKKKRAEIAIITFEDEGAINCLKKLFEVKGANAVLCALECFDPIGFTGQEIQMFWERCGGDLEKIHNIIANVHGNRVALGDFSNFTLRGIPINNLLPLEKLPPDALNPTFPL
ncbi:MAG: hypothetical protein ACM3UU_09550 [Ignavibacteriales bacterium]